MGWKGGRHFRGTSLLELLLAIAIAVLLAAILTPVLLVALRSSKIRACANNEHQILLGLQQYLADSGGMFPPDALGFDTFDVGYRSGKPVNIFNWSQGSTFRLLAELKPYGVISSQLKCPLDEYFGKKVDGHLGGTHQFSSYVSAWVPYEWYFEPSSESAVLDGSKWCIIQDTYLPGHRIDFMQHVETVHGDNGNFAFFDGHIHSLPAQGGHDCMVNYYDWSSIPKN